MTRMKGRHRKKWKDNNRGWLSNTAVKLTNSKKRWKLVDHGKRMSCSHKQGKFTKDNRSNKLQVRPYLLSVPVICYENITFILLRQAHSVYYIFLIEYSFPYLHVLSSQRLLWLITDRTTPSVFTKLILFCSKVQLKV